MFGSIFFGFLEQNVEHWRCSADRSTNLTFLEQIVEQILVQPSPALSVEPADSAACFSLAILLFWRM